jgi:DNA invertase Pin-like site-specific DNA recombinase
MAVRLYVCDGWTPGDQPYSATPIYRPATEAEVRSAYAAFIGARRRKPGGPKPKLGPAQVAEIRKRLAAGEKPGALAKEYGVSRFTIHRVN